MLLSRDAQCRLRSVDGSPDLLPGAILRYVGTYPDDSSKTTESVIFITVPRLALQTVPEGNSPGFNNPNRTSQSLLNYLHGYNVGYDRESRQAVCHSSTTKDRTETGYKVLHVEQTWIILLGSGQCRSYHTIITRGISLMLINVGVIISIGNETLNDLCGHDLRIIYRDAVPLGPVLVCIDICLSPSLSMVVERACNFAVSSSTRYTLFVDLMLILMY